METSLLNRNTKLSPAMTLAQFENGYWYATGLKEFAESIGVPSAHRLRKDELEKPFAPIPHGRYINFVRDFFAAEKGATREQAVRAWKELKKLNVPKDYRSWTRSHIEA
jgi:hypothetical protein